MRVTKICKMCGAEFLGNTNARYCGARCRMDYQTQYAREYRETHREQIRDYNRKYQRGYSKLVRNIKEKENADKQSNQKRKGGHIIIRY